MPNERSLPGQDEDRDGDRSSRGREKGDRDYRRYPLGPIERSEPGRGPEIVCGYYPPGVG
jgi:hypothetical protein